MMFDTDKLYKHINCLDTCIRVSSKQETSEGFLLKIDWLNFRYNLSYIASEEVFIPVQAAKYWEEFNITEAV